MAIWKKWEMSGSPLGHFSWFTALSPWEWLCKAVCLIFRALAVVFTSRDGTTHQ